MRAYMHYTNIYIYTKILEVNLYAFAYRLFHEDFSSILGTFALILIPFPSFILYFKLIWEVFMNW